MAKPFITKRATLGLRTITLLAMNTLILAAAVVIALSTLPAQASSEKFGPANPFFAPSTLPFQAPPFDKIKDGDYQPAMEAGMAEQRKEVQAIADNPAPPTFDNTFVAMEKSGQLLQRVLDAFFAVTAANTNPELQKVRATEAPKLAAHQDAIFLDPKLFQRVATIYQQRQALKLDPESMRLVEYSYDQFVHAGAKLSDADKTELKKLNAELATLSNDFTTKLLAATKAAAYVTDGQSGAGGSERCADQCCGRGGEESQGGGLRSAVAEHYPAARSGRFDESRHP